MLALHQLKSSLVGQRVRLVRLAEEHRAGLRDIARDECIWEFYPLEGNRDEAFNAWFDASLEEAERLVTWAYAVHDLASGRLIGTTRYEFIVAEHDHLSIGGTWLDPITWGAGYNPDMKYLLIEHAFEGLDVYRIQIRVDRRNARSLAAVRALGATEEGVLREIYRTADGLRTDRVVFSILRREWPQVYEKLAKRRARTAARSLSAIGA